MEVVSPASRSERTDRVRKVKEYAAIGIPQYWLVDVMPEPKVQVFALDEAARTYRLARTGTSGGMLDLEIEADQTISVSFDPKMLAETWQR
ncbi:Uma2 family endonuclease [Actinomadura sp. WMMB 499]|uniref:Uma2 family endonuclease n=1 Tax=Actinomadura sp. WMMB 499 TaxID=1219491 RepID=UPI0020C75053|nr:Uma2 family endonuclease [Actinomadura sp. WMMB 499]